MRSGLRPFLDRLYRRYHNRASVYPDPLFTLYGYEDVKQREVAALIASLLAYGNVKAILKAIESVTQRMGGLPRDYLLEESPRAIVRDFSDFRYRVTGPHAISALMLGVRRVLLTYGRLETCFAAHAHTSDTTVLPALSGFVDELSVAHGRDIKHLLPAPARGSACKRLMLYLRWMIRKDEVDPGGWCCASPAQLVIPLDTHVRQMAAMLRLTRRKQANMKTAMEITDSLRRVCPDDPLRYDFAMTRPGILRHVISQNDFIC